VAEVALAQQRPGRQWHPLVTGGTLALAFWNLDQRVVLCLYPLDQDLAFRRRSNRVDDSTILGRRRRGNGTINGRAGQTSGASFGHPRARHRHRHRHPAHAQARAVTALLSATISQMPGPNPWLTLCSRPSWLQTKTVTVRFQLSAM